MKKGIYVVLLALLTPSFVRAQLVNCGNRPDDPCTYSDFIELIKTVVRFALFNIGVPLVVGMIIWGGVTMMISGGDKGKVAEGRKIIQSAVVGFAIALGAWLIIETIRRIAFGQ